jgi:hypothetical protein
MRELLSFAEIPLERDIFLYGTGKLGRYIYESLVEIGLWKISGFIDTTHGGSLRGETVFSLDEYVQRRNKDDFLIICSSFENEIASELNARRIEEYYNASFLYENSKLIVNKNLRLPGDSPPIFLNTMPKSGTMYLARTMENLLGLQNIYVAPTYFPESFIDPSSMNKFVLQRHYTVNHVPPHPTNLRVIEYYMKTFWLHIRDPRQATLSYFHPLEGFRNRPRYLLGHLPELPTDYFDRTTSDRLSWQIRNWLPQLIEWLTNWLNVIDNGLLGTCTLVTTHTELHDDERALLQKVLDFHGIEISLPAGQFAEHSAATHFRKGRTDEWLEVFDATQRAEASALVPASLKERFQWPD